MWFPYFEPKQWLIDHPEVKLENSKLTATQLLKYAKEITAIRTKIRMKALELENTEIAAYK